MSPATIGSLCLSGFLAAGAPEILDVDFSAASSELCVGEGVRIEDDAAWLEDGAGVATASEVFGDFSVELGVSVRDGSRLSVSIAGGDVEAEVRFGEAGLARISGPTGEVASLSLGSPALPRRMAVRNRGEAVEILLDGRAVLDHVFEQPLRGGVVRAQGDGVGVLRLTVRRLPWIDGLRIEGLDETSRAELRLLPIDRFELLDPPPARIDPVYRIGVVGSDREPMQVRFCGVRPPSDDSIPLLQQGLALLGIRPYVRIRVWTGEGGDGSRAIEIDGQDEVSVRPGPGVVEVAALCGSEDPSSLPAITVWDVSGERERILDRCAPFGPARRNVWAHLPEECTRISIRLTGVGSAGFERTLAIRR